MRTWGLNPWQRIVVVIGTLACLARSWQLYDGASSDSHPGAPFLAAIVLAVLALSRPPEGERALPAVSMRRLRQSVIAVAAVASIGVVLIVIANYENSRTVAAVTYQIPPEGFGRPAPSPTYTMPDLSGLERAAKAADRMPKVEPHEVAGETPALSPAPKTATPMQAPEPTDNASEDVK
jgi:hypothetical protein